MYEGQITTMISNLIIVGKTQTNMRVIETFFFIQVVRNIAGEVDVEIP